MENICESYCKRDGKTLRRHNRNTDMLLKKVMFKVRHRYRMEG